MYSKPYHFTTHLTTMTFSNKKCDSLCNAMNIQKGGEKERKKIHQKNHANLHCTKILVSLSLRSPRDEISIAACSKAYTAA